MCIVLLVFGCGSEQENDQGKSTTIVFPKENMGTIVAVGNSLTAGYGVDETEAYPALLEERLTADGYRFQVINAGVSGETSSGTLSRINWVLSSLDPDIVILEAGANDGLRGIKSELVKEILDSIVKILRENDVQVILAGMKILPNLGPEYTKAFAAVFPKVASSHGIHLIPFFLEPVAGEPELNQSDRIHPTAEGYRRIVDHIYPDVYLYTLAKPSL